MVVNQRTSVEASGKIQQAQPLPSVLKVALSSLDVNLEDELTRYRRQRAGYPAPHPRGIKTTSASPKSLDLISIYPDGNRVRSTSASNGARSTTPSTLPTQDKSPSVQASGIAAASIASQVALPLSTDLAQPFADTQPKAGGAIHSEATPLKPALVKFDAREDGDEIEGANSDLANLPPTNPYDYLESSEELLKSLSEEEPDFSEPNFLSNLFTPLGVGSMLVLLLSSATLGYLVMNPSSLQHLGFSRLFKNPQMATPSGPTDDNTLPGSGAQSGDRGSSLPNSPDLSSQEFVNLDLNTLSTLKPSGNETVPNLSPSRTAAQSSTVKSAATVGANPSVGTTASGIVTTPSASVYTPGTIAPVGSAPTSLGTQAPVPSISRSTTVAPLPSAIAPSVSTSSSPKFPSPSQRSTTSTAAPSQTATPSQPASPTANSTQASPSGQPSYIVVTPYTGDQTLESAKKVVPGAYVRNLPEGAKVQFGAFSNPEKAEGLVQQLQEQGIQAEVKPR